MDKTTVVLEDVINYYHIFNELQNDFGYSKQNNTTNGYVFQDNKKNKQIIMNGRVDDDEGTTTIVVECDDKNISQDIEQWVLKNYD